MPERDGGGDVTWPENRQWLDERINRGDNFVLVSPESGLSDTRVPGVPNGYYTYLELKYLQRQGVGVFHAY